MRPLEPTGDELRALLSTVVDYVVGVVDGLPSAPASTLDGIPALLADPELRRLPPPTGRPIAELLPIVDRAAAVGLHSAGPGYLAFTPGSGLVASAAAELVANVLNRYTGVSLTAPGLVAMEQDLLRWMAGLFDLPESTAGLLTTGGSLAMLSAVVTARWTKVGYALPHATAYVGDQAHASAAKAFRLAGFPPEAVRVVPVDAEYRMDVAALRAAVRGDRSAGLRPFCVVASAGTTNTGAIDPLPEIADLAAEEDLWFHVDAAYGGFFQLTDRGRARMRGIERADSLVLDAHKGLFLPFGLGCLLVRDGQALREAHTGPDADYLQDVRPRELPNFADYGPELSREFRGLRMWLPLHLHGVDAFRDALDEKLDLAAYVYAELHDHPRLELLTEPPLSTVAFVCRDGSTEDLVAAVNAERRVYMSTTRIDGRYTGRICVLNHRTDRARIDEVIASIRRHLAA